ncbi:MAG: class II fructose-bisphosphate aldolase, partial [Verrucomicrobiota bacterium]|nr:class II fructose-bisphosphate aldolase [Verrucomicrobiota bacterium]
NEIILEVEAGVVGGEEDGSAGTEDMPAEKLYTTPEDMLIVYESLNGIGRYMFAATFGNVHGAYKPGAVKLRPDILKQGQDAVTGKHGEAAKFDLVFHGGSGSEKHQIKETLEYGVIKMNIDTDTQYAFTRPIADHMMTNYEGVLKIDGEVGNKKVYDPRSYLKKAEQATADRLVEACNDLESTSKTIFGTV